MFRPLLLAASLLLISLQGFAQRQCATAVYDSLMQKRYPQWAQGRAELERRLQEKPKPGDNLRLMAVDSVIRIPIVVHVIHHEANSQPGTRGNISDEQIMSQIEVLNEDYRRKPGTRGYNDDAVGADMQLEFFLATCDPEGNPTSGITRTYNSQTAWDVYFDDERLKKLSYWPNDQYLNIWVTTLSNDFIGYTQFPNATTLPGLNSYNGPDSTDGVVIDQRVFGRRIGTVTSRLYGYGRTTTHEIGHWLGLKHTWGDAYCGDDYCADTPPTESANQSDDTTCAPIYSYCDGTQTMNMIQNYLDYSPDVCMNIFTQDQKARAWKTLDISPRRKKLVENAARCAPLPASERLTINVFPNPETASSSGVTNLEILLKGSQQVHLQIYDALGRTVFSKDYGSMPSALVNFQNGMLPTGIYFITVTTSGGEKAVKRLAIFR